METKQQQQYINRFGYETTLGDVYPINVFATLCQIGDLTPPDGVGYYATAEYDEYSDNPHIPEIYESHQQVTNFNPYEIFETAYRHGFDYVIWYNK